MARPSNGGWDFIKEGSVVQYKEDSMIMIVEIIEDRSTDEMYEFEIKPLAGNWDVSESFTVSFNRSFNGAFNGMSQFYENMEYMPLPFGKTWPYIFDAEKTDKFMETK